MSKIREEGGVETGRHEEVRQAAAAAGCWVRNGLLTNQSGLLAKRKLLG